MTLYTSQKTRDGKFIVSKLDDEMNVDGYYTLTKNGPGMTCDCASHKPYCKHMDILKAMIQRNAVSTGTFYDMDHDTWYPPIGESVL